MSRFDPPDPVAVLSDSLSLSSFPSQTSPGIYQRYRFFGNDLWQGTGLILPSNITQYTDDDPDIMDDMAVAPYGCTTWGLQRPEASYFHPFRTSRGASCRRRRGLAGDAGTSCSR